MYLRLLSEERVVLMGASIFVIMLFHTFWGKDNTFLYRFIGYGYIAVEWFLVLSGIGAYFALFKQPRLHDYWIKRLIRIVPAYLLIAPIVYLYNNYNLYGCDMVVIVETLKDLFFLKIFESIHSFWYILMILCCYIIAPAFYLIIYKSNSLSICVFCMITLTIVCRHQYISPEIIISRFPSFLCGMLLGHYIKTKPMHAINSIIVCFWLLISIALMLIIANHKTPMLIVRMVHLFSTVPILLCFAYILPNLGFVATFMRALGGVTLELYLIHQNVALLFITHFIENRAITLVLSIGLSYVLANLLRKLLKSLTPIR